MSTERRSSVGERLRLVFDRIMEFKELGIFLAFLILFVSVGIAHPNFLGRANLYNVARQTSYLLPIAFMVMFVMVTAGIDISVGRVSALCGCVAGYVLVNGGSLPLGLLAGAATGAVFGYVNGWTITNLHLPPMIATLGTMYVAYGLSLVLTAGNPLYPLPKSFLFLGQGNWAGIPVVTWVAAVIGVLAWIALYKTPYGYWLCALGGNKEAARRAGLPVKALEISAYVLSGLAAAIAGMLFAGRCSVAKPDLGDNWEMQAIAAVVIGGTSLFGGSGSVLGTLIGSTIMTMLTSVLVFLKVPAYWQDVVIGAIILVAVSLDAYQRRVKFVPTRIKKKWDVADGVVERPNLGLVLKGAGLPEMSMMDDYGKNGGKPILEVKGISKYFGYVQALDAVDFELYPGEVVALVGDNGAGKSTLVKCASGSLTPDEGEIFVRGKKAVFNGPRDALDHGIAVLYQDLALVDGRDIPNNLFLGREPRRRFKWIIDRKRMEEGAKLMLSGLRINIPSVKIPVGYLSGGQRQEVATGKAISQGASIIFLDEPTAALGVRESRQIISLIEELKEAGCSVVVISHNLAHVFAVADRIFVLRGGRRVGSWKKNETTAEHIVATITGATVLETIDSGES